jgi:hypothetical protein
VKFLETLALVPIEELQLKGCNWDVEVENHVDLMPNPSAYLSSC